MLTGISLFIATAARIHAGFPSPQVLADYVLMYSLPAASKTSRWMLLVMGVVFLCTFLLSAR